LALVVKDLFILLVSLTPQSFATANKPNHMAIKTLDVDLLGSQYDNIYEAVCITAKRARQISASTRTEMTDRLSYFDGFDRDPEDRRMNDQQVGISLEYERAPKPTETALDELVAGKLSYKYIEPDVSDF